MYFLNNILKVLGIDEEIDDILPTEMITMNKKDKLKVFNNFLDFTVITKSGKIIIFEFKKNSIRSRDLKQVFDYYRKVYCKEKIDVEIACNTYEYLQAHEGGTVQDIVNYIHETIDPDDFNNETTPLKIDRHLNQMFMYDLLEFEGNRYELTPEFVELVENAGGES